MGITGLLPMLKKASSACHVRKFSGATVAIDAYCWLHKGAFGCAAQLGKGEPTTAYITYCVKYINILLAHNIKPILVLDGRNLPSKELTEKKRREKREENRKKAREFLKKGMNKEAWECFTRCVDITPAMAREFIKVLRTMKIDYVVAPYEADAQLAYLAINNFVDIVITEDSDLILFGCPKIFFKMNSNGDGVLFDKTRIPKALGFQPNKEFNFSRFRWMCILSGCDYLPSIPGIGLGRAKKLILEKAESEDIVEILKSLPSALQLDVEVTDEYIQGFIKAELTFLHQLVFDTLEKRLVPLTPYSGNTSPDKVHFAGEHIEDKLAFHLAAGNVDLHSLQKVDNFDPCASLGCKGNSIWSTGYTKSSSKLPIKIGSAGRDSAATAFESISSKEATSRKRKHLETDTSTPPSDNDLRDGDLLNMYSSSSSNFNDSPDLEEEVSELEVSFEQHVSTKRHKFSISSQSQVSSDEETDENIKTPCAEPEPEPLPTRRKNPFLKSATSPVISRPQENDCRRNPVCLIERNKVYQEEYEAVIVKSQYFRQANGSVHEETTSVVRRTRSSCTKIDEVDSLPFRIAEEMREVEDDSQLTIYSLDENNDVSAEDPAVADSSSLKNSQESLNSNPECISIDDEEVECSVRSSSQPLPQQRRSPRKRPPTVLGRCKTPGLSKGYKKAQNKLDPKQKTISSMFALQPKPKL